MTTINGFAFSSLKKAFQDLSWIGYDGQDHYQKPPSFIPSNTFVGADLSNTRFRPRSRYHQKLDFTDTDFRGSFVSDVTFTACNFRKALLAGTTFYNCTFNDCDFCGQDLSTTSFKGSVFSKLAGNVGNADDCFIGVTPPVYTNPFAGQEIIAYKKVSVRCGSLLNAVARLRIPADARRVQTLGMNRKLRAERAFVLEIVSLDYKNKTKINTAYSRFDMAFRYEVGKWVEPRNGYDPSFVRQCAGGIHFFLTENAAKRYNF